MVNGKMTIKEFSKEKAKLEENIRAELNRLLLHFRTRTGYTPQYINIDMIEATSIGSDDVRTFIVNDCTLDIPL